MSHRIAFISISREGAENPIRVRLDQIAAVGPSSLEAVKVTTVSGVVLLGSRPVGDVWAAMREASNWLNETTVIITADQEDQ